MNDKITVCLGKGGQREMAESFARKNNVPIMDKPGEHLTVMFDSRGVSLTGYGLNWRTWRCSRPAPARARQRRKQ